MTNFKNNNSVTTISSEEESTMTLFEALNTTLEGLIKNTVSSIKRFVTGKDIIEEDLRYVSHLYDETYHRHPSVGFDLQRFAAKEESVVKTSLLGALGWLVVDPSDLFITVNGVRRSLRRVWFIAMMALALLLAYTSCSYAEEQPTSIHGTDMMSKSAMVLDSVYEEK